MKKVLLNALLASFIRIVLQEVCTLLLQALEGLQDSLLHLVPTLPASLQPEPPNLVDIR